MAGSVDREAVLSTISLGSIGQEEIEYMVSFGIFEFLCCLKIEDLLFLKKVLPHIDPSMVDLLHAEACACGPCPPDGFGGGGAAPFGELADCQKEVVAYICGDAVQTVVAALIILVKGQESKDYSDDVKTYLKWFRMFLTALQLVCVDKERATTMLAGICAVYLWWRSHEGTARTGAWTWLTVMFPILSTLMNLLGEKIENCCREKPVNRGQLPEWAIELTKE